MLYYGYMPKVEGRLRAEEKRKKELQQEVEIINEIGQESDIKAKPLVQQLMKESEEGATKREMERLNKLEMAKSAGGIRTYVSLLTDLLDKRMRYVDWERGWTYSVSNDGVGIILKMFSPSHRTFQAAFRPTQQAMYDLNAVNLYGIRAENTMERLRKEAKVPSKGNIEEKQ